MQRVTGIEAAPRLENCWTTYAHRIVLRVGVTGLFALIFVFWGEPTGLVVLLLAVLLLAVLGLIELIGRRPRPGVADHARIG